MPVNCYPPARRAAAGLPLRGLIQAGAIVGLLVSIAVGASAQQAGPPAASPPAGGGPGQGAAGAAAPAPPPPIQFKVLFNVDYVSQEPLAQPPNLGFGLRRARLFAQLNGPAGLAFRLHFDPTALANGPQSAAPFRAVPLVEAYLEYALPANLLFRVGQQRVPYTLNATTGAPSMPVPEYNQLSRYTVQRASAFRDIGVTLNGRTAGAEYSVGVFNGAGINTVTDNDSTRDYAARLAYTIVPGFQIGGSAWKGHTGNLFVRSQGAPPIKAFFDNADVRRSDIDTHLGLGALDVAAEYGWETLQHNAKALNPTPGNAELQRSGYSVTAGLRLGAFAPALKRLELAGRYDKWDPNRKVDNDQVTEYTLGGNFYFHMATAPADPILGRLLNFAQRESRLMVFWEFDRPEAVGASAPAGALLKRNTQRFHVRWELFY
jgi:hypothetical protein